MNKQQQIDALSNENVRMSTLLQDMANMFPAFIDILREKDYIVAEFRMKHWMDEMAAMDITPREEVRA